MNDIVLFAILVVANRLIVKQWGERADRLIWLAIAVIAIFDAVLGHSILWGLAGLSALWMARPRNTALTQAKVLGQKR